MSHQNVSDNTTQHKPSIKDTSALHVLLLFVSGNAHSVLELTRHKKEIKAPEMTNKTKTDKW